MKLYGMNMLLSIPKIFFKILLNFVGKKGVLISFAIALTFPSAFAN